MEMTATLAGMLVKFSGHDIVKLSLQHDHQLTAQLKTLMTTDPMEGIMTVATGIPPHIELANQVMKVLETTKDITRKFEGQTSKLIDAVKHAIEQKAWDSGHVMGGKLVDMLNEFQSTHLKAVDKRLNGARQEFARAMDRNASTVAVSADDNPTPTSPSTNAGVSYTFMYQGKFHSAPSHFEFPKPKLREAVRFWLCGQSVSDDGQKHVKPFKDLSNNMLPTKELKDAFELS